VGSDQDLDEAAESDDAGVAYLDVEHRDALLTHYEHSFGRPFSILYHEKVSEVVHLDTYIYSPTDERPFITAATVGMSAMPLVFKGDPDVEQDQADEHGHRELSNELIIYLDQNWDFGSSFGLAPILILNYIARYPHAEKSAIWPGLSFGYSKRPIIEGSLLTDLFLRRPVYENIEGSMSDVEHCDLPGGKYCHLMWLIPITVAECYIKRTEGAEALYHILTENDYFTLDVDRRCFVSTENRAQRRAREKAQRLRAKRSPSKSVFDLECMDNEHDHAQRPRA
jgi:hypothetical protein